MPRPPDFIELGERRDCIRIPILFEDRSVLVLDKPAGWMLVPFNWQRTPWNLQAAITSALRAGYHWAKARNLKFLQNIHRLDAETTGILLFGKSPGAVETYSDLFESRKMEKRYLVVVDGTPKQPEWVCEARLATAPGQIGRMVVNPKTGKDAVTAFRVLASKGRRTLVEARPWTGRTHQIRVHLAHDHLPIVGDSLYGRSNPPPDARFPMGLRAVELAWRDPFRKVPVKVIAPEQEFLAAFDFGPERSPPAPAQTPRPTRWQKPREEQSRLDSSRDARQ